MTTESSVAYQALNLSKQNEQKIEAHEDLCAERYKTINSTMSEMKGMMKWFGSIIVVTMIGAMGYLMSHQNDAIDQRANVAAQEIRQLRHDLRDAQKLPPQASDQP